MSWLPAAVAAISGKKWGITTSRAMAGLKDLLQVLPPYARLGHTSSSLLALWVMQKLHPDNMSMVKLDRKVALRVVARHCEDASTTDSHSLQARRARLKCCCPSPHSPIHETGGQTGAECCPVTNGGVAPTFSSLEPNDMRFAQLLSWKKVWAPRGEEPPSLIFAFDKC